MSSGLQYSTLIGSMRAGDAEIFVAFTIAGVVMRFNSELIIQSKLRNCGTLRTGRHVISNPRKENMNLSLIFGLMLWIDREHVHAVGFVVIYLQHDTLYLLCSRKEFLERNSQAHPRYAPNFIFFAACG